VSRLAVLHAMPNLTRPFGGPVEALIGFIAASAPDTAVTVIGPRCPDAERDWLAQQLPGDARIVFSSAWGSELRDLARRADLVHVHGLLNPFSSSAATIALAARRPTVIDPFGTLSRYTFTHRRQLLKQLYFQVLDGPNVRRAHAMHFTTAAERDEAAWHGIDFTGRSHVVPPPWRSPITSSRAHAGDTVLFLSRLHPKKGLDVLLSAWPLVRARREAARLVIAGAGKHTIETMPGVEYVGFVSGEAKRARFAEADVFVLPSHHENFGVAVLEAVAAGVPAVVSPGVQLAPWIAERRFGAVVDREPSALADAILAVLDDAPLRARVAEHGAEAVVADFGVTRVAPALRAMYDSAIQRCSS
jgi:glycosyltransferase involved in cell wall biosynthesis